MLAEARKRAAGLSGVEFVEGDSENLPFGDGEFTAVLCTTSLHHYPRPEKAAREMARVLAPGGRVVIGDGTAAYSRTPASSVRRPARVGAGSMDLPLGARQVWTTW